MTLYIIYTAILVYVSFILFRLFLKEKQWKNQLALILVLIVFILRILQIK